MSLIIPQAVLRAHLTDGYQWTIDCPNPALTRWTSIDFFPKDYPRYLYSSLSDWCHADRYANAGCHCVKNNTPRNFGAEYYVACTSPPGRRGIVNSRAVGYCFSWCQCRPAPKEPETLDSSDESSSDVVGMMKQGWVGYCTIQPESFYKRSADTAQSNKCYPGYYCKETATKNQRVVWGSTDPWPDGVGVCTIEKEL